RAIAHLFAQVADVGDAACGCRVDLDQVQRAVLERSLAQRARIVGVAVLRVQAVDGAVQDARHAGLAGAARASEQVRVRGPAKAHRVAQGASDVFLADDIFKTPWSPPEI